MWLVGDIRLIFIVVLCIVLHWVFCSSFYGLRQPSIRKFWWPFHCCLWAVGEFNIIVTNHVFGCFGSNHLFGRFSVSNHLFGRFGVSNQWPPVWALWGQQPPVWALWGQQPPVWALWGWSWGLRQVQPFFFFFETRVLLLPVRATTNTCKGF